MALNDTLNKIISKEIKKQNASNAGEFKVLVRKANTRKIQTKTIKIKSF